MNTEVMKNESGNVTRLDDRRPRTVYRPATDIFETDNAVVIEAEMPGVSRDKVDITLENRVLTIRGEAEAHAREGWRPVYGEYGEGDYERVFSLSEDIDSEKIDASFRNGVLRLELPKAESVKSRKISVKAA
ncbi:Hsp20/alpha crystallin family protein [Hyphococcus sp.]|uniref:Hsp20/alpha crystallin family protein n=1 Tax=Hyphococcus sp. TaxID=2038636 RepID=UPI003D0D0243